MGVSFSADPTAKGFFAPLRFEANLIDCEVEGEIPAGPALTLGVTLDLNRATETELALVPGVGPSLARSLVEARSADGGFRTWDEVDRVPGIGPAKLMALQSAAEIR